MFSFFKKHPKQNELPKPKFSLIPQADGSYFLEKIIIEYDKYDGYIECSKIVGTPKTEEEGRQMIANLERPAIQL